MLGCAHGGVCLIVHVPGLPHGLGRTLTRTPRLDVAGGERPDVLAAAARPLVSCDNVRRLAVLEHPFFPALSCRTRTAGTNHPGICITP